MKNCAFLLAATAFLAAPSAFAEPLDGTPSRADTAETEEAKDSPDSDIVVNGRKQQKEISGGALGTRSNLETPFSITSVDSDDIEKLRALTTADYFVGDASVTRDGGSRYNIHSQWVTVRGAAVRTQLYNGVPLRDSQGADTPPEFLEQVQLLKGAGSFIYGYAAPGGVINFVTKKPTETLLANISVGWQSAALFRQHVDIGDTVGPVGFRLNAVQEFGRTYADSEILRQGAAIGLRVDLSPDIAWRTDAFYQRNQIDGAEPSFVVGGNASPAVPTYRDRVVPAPVSGRTRFASRDTYTDGRLYSAITSLTWQVNPDWYVRLTGGQVGNDHRLPYERIMLLNQAGDYSLRLFNGRNVYRNRLGSVFVEGKFATFGLSHQLNLGLDWRDSLGRHAENLATFQAGSNIFRPVLARWTYDDRRDLEIRPLGWNEEKSAFVSDTITIADTVSVIAGARYTDYHSRAWAWRSQQRTSDYRTDGVTPTFALLYRPSSALTFYGSYIQALSEGTIVSNLYDNVGDILPALASRQYEVGAKWEWDRFSGAVALFRLDRGANFVTDDNRLVQDGIERYQGIEVSARVVPVPTVSLGASTTFVDGTHERATNRWLVGRQLHGVARVTAVFDASYDPAFLAGVGLRALVRYQGKAAIFNNQPRDWTVYTPGVWLATLGGDYRFQLGGREFTLRGQVQNLFDTRYWNSGTSTCCYSLSPGQPRTASIDLKVSL